MKFILLTAICLAAIPLSASAQDENADGSASQRGAVVLGITNPIRPRTRMESMLNRKGSLIVKGYTEIRVIEGANQSSIRVLAVELTDTGRQNKEHGVAIEVRQAGQPDHISVAYIDYDEIDAFIAGLDAMAKLDSSSTQLKDLSASFRTLGDLEVRSVERNGGRVVAVEAVQVHGPASELIWATAYFPTSQLADIGQQMQSAKQALDAIKARSK